MMSCLLGQAEILASGPDKKLNGLDQLDTVVHTFVAHQHHGHPVGLLGMSAQ